uniref:Uncharacterized protein n=1 Tax=Opuntia streptacantha TaxID=393608 RepID=A0A7C9AWE9_OPUST
MPQISWSWVLQILQYLRRQTTQPATQAITCRPKKLAHKTSHNPKNLHLVLASISMHLHHLFLMLNLQTQHPLPPLHFLLLPLLLQLHSPPPLLIQLSLQSQPPVKLHSCPPHLHLFQLQFSLLHPLLCIP